MHSNSLPILDYYIHNSNELFILIRSSSNIIHFYEQWTQCITHFSESALITHISDYSLTVIPYNDIKASQVSPSGYHFDSGVCVH